MNGKPTDLAELERPILDLEAQIRALEMDPAKAKERERLRKKAEKLKAEVFASITDWQRSQLARHPRRPYTLDYIERICDRFEEIHGDRAFADDAAIVGGLGWIAGQPVMVIGQQKGRDTKQKIIRNFGMPRPEGYRKALRLMKLAEKFNRPVLCLIDTQGAFPGLDAEERGQAEAIARNLKEMARLKVPVVAVVIGEGGSGGALALGVANTVLMQEYAVYSVITPEGCASILWKDAAQAPAAAEALRLTAPHLLEQGIIDAIVPEPLGGAHGDWDQAAVLLKEAVTKAFADLAPLDARALVDQRYTKFARMGSVIS
ncbi:acetyl-CoA carboxylase carboxyltransferase subunit alpha [Mesoterricola sediminis]|uniref:Acetyl-coenzyme A carboxylase carboxyl transferase subunit alpha n=1 Tax=Mesoterricola sediminis TaxID=2927980 RepID=A0AA48HEX6_9BACT|nr:acetyl-CoA carboxylase carboxyltransferase subunit alpha [Mesoterricola sediminis]BDU76998.1 acetyl-coenzyme A carboxylase carboxyl transferase subunit alpha [Mesoterricola sediminis]